MATVTEKRLWREVLKISNSGTANPNSSSLRTIQQCYSKLLLPYECHVNNTDISLCMSKQENSVSRHTSISSPSSQLSSDSERERVNHQTDNAKFESSNSIDARMNGEANIQLPDRNLMNNERLANRVNSKESDSSVYTCMENNSKDTSASQLNSNSASQDDPAALQKLVNSHDHKKEDSNNSLDIPEGSQNSVDSYSQGITEPLPEMSVQDAESVLGMSPSPYPNQQAPGGPATPSAANQSVASPSHFPPSYQQQLHGSSGTPQAPPPPSIPPTSSAQQCQQASGTPGPVGMTPGTGGSGSQEYMDMNDPAPTPPAYPPPYPMDPYQHPPPHPSSNVPPGYPSYNSSSPHRQYPATDMPHDYSQHPMQQQPSPMMRYPYDPASAMGRGLYPPNMPPSMPMQTPMDYQSAAAAAAHYRSHVMQHPHSPMVQNMRDMPPYPGGGAGGGAAAAAHGMSPEWHWQQHQQRQLISALPPHLQQTHMYQRMQQQAYMRQHQQRAALAAMQQHNSSRGSPGLSPGGSGSGGHGSVPSTPTDPIKIHWQEQNMLNKELGAKMHGDKVSASPKPAAHRMEIVPENKILPVKSTDQSHALKRVLPDWSNCVEGTKPQLIKRRKLYSADCGHVEPWRIMMSLKSGLLAESTWALDTLNILLHDDRTVGFFHLKHHHNLLNTVVNHFKITLTAIFDLKFNDMPKFLPDHEGVEVSTAESLEGDNKDSYTTELLSHGCATDFDVLLKASKSRNACCNENGVDSEVKSSDLFPSGIIPVANVFNSGKMKLGKSDDLSHITIPTLDDSLFPNVEGDRNILPESERKDLEAQSKLQRHDQTPVSVLLQREALLTQIPLHRFGRLSRSPRRRERSFFEDIRKRESLSMISEEVDKSSTTGSSSKDASTVSSENRNKECKRMNTTGNSSKDSSSVSSESRNKECKTSRIVGSTSSISRSRTPSLSDNTSPVFFPKRSPPSVPSPTEVLVEESEVYQKEELPLWSISPSKEQLISRCMCISNILRSLSFIPGNDYEFSQNSGILIVLGQLLMLHHYHLIHSKSKKLSTDSTTASSDTPSTAASVALSPEKNTDSSNESSVHSTDLLNDSSVFSANSATRYFKNCKDYWWWDLLELLRENTLVILSNISGQLDLSIFPEVICYPIIDGLLHWSVCTSSLATDPLPDSAKVFSLSAQRLVLETLAKMSISEVNIDLILATPPLTRLDRLFMRLGQFIGQKKYPVVRQFALVLLSNLAQGNEVASRLLGQQKMVISLLLECIEIAEHAACVSGGHLVGGYNPDDPNSLSVAMLRRAATTLHCLSKVPANRTAFLPYRDRTLYLATSQYVELSISSILMDMLFEFGKL